MIFELRTKNAIRTRDRRKAILSLNRNKIEMNIHIFLKSNEFEISWLLSIF